MVKLERMCKICGGMVFKGEFLLGKSKFHKQEIEY